MNPTSLRLFVYNYLIANGLPPRSDTIARHFGVDVANVKRALAELNIGKTLIVHPGTGEIWMAGVFSANPTNYKVIGSATWYANCAWDMLGIPIITQEVTRIETSCVHCNQTMTFTGYPDRPPEVEDAVVHYLVPARNWYDDIGFT